MRTTDNLQDVRVSKTTHRRRAFVVALLCAAIAVPGLALSGCSKKAPAATSQTGSQETSATTGHMAGPAVEVHIPQSAVDAQPAPWNLSTPESAVRSYNAWVAYAYRIGQSQVATPTMSGAEEVRMDSYNQFNLEKKRVLDEKLTSISFGKPSKGATSTLLPAKETWTYSYLSVAEGNKSVGGPYDISYDATYTLLKTKKGWVVDSVAAKAQGKVK